MEYFGFELRMVQYIRLGETEKVWEEWRFQKGELKGRSAIVSYS